MLDSTDNVPALLESLAAGNKAAAEELFPLVYEELHRLAAGFMRHERSNHTLQPTALIHEAYLRLMKSRENATTSFENIGHFISTAAVVMRRILVNHAKAKQAEKRGGGKPLLQIDDIAAEFERRSVDLVALDDAMERLKMLDAVQYRLVELRFFGGMTYEQCADTLGISERAVYYEWAHAKAWLRGQLGSEQ